MNRTLPMLATTALLLTGCPPDGTRPGAPLEVTRITPEAPSIVYYSALGDPLRAAVFDAAKFADLWAEAFAHRSPAPALPSVDFEREFVVVVALGERSSGGFGIEVMRAETEGSGVVAEVVASAPGKDCVVSMAMSQPLDIVKIRRASAGAVAVRFVEKAVIRDCGR